MKNKIAFATGLLLASGIFASQAKADSVTIPLEFAGNINNRCVLETSTNGNLVRGNDSYYVTSSPSNGGIDGEVILTCDTSATISVDNPVANGGQGLPNEIRTEAEVFYPENVVIASSPSLSSITSSIISDSSPVTLYVRMNVYSDETIGTVSLSYTVNVTATPD